MAIIYGTNGGDSLGGSAAVADQLFGWDASNPPGDEGPGNDNDHIFAGAGDMVQGGGGNDDIVAEVGHRLIQMFGGAGDDMITSGVGLSNLISGGDGVDLWVSVQTDGMRAVHLNVADLGAGINLDVGKQAGATWVVGIERVSLIGSDYNDRIIGGAYDDTIFGGGGQDYLAGGGGNDMLHTHVSTTSTLTGYDSVFGGTGDDTVMAVGSNPHLLLRGGAGIDLLQYGMFDTIGTVLTLDRNLALPDGTRANGFERFDFSTGAGNDIITGGNLDDTLRSGGGNDTLYGMGGDDSLSATLTDLTDVQLLDGGAGDDTIEAMPGIGVHLFGGAGTDLLIVSLVGEQAGVELAVPDLVVPHSFANGTVAEGFERVDLIGSSFADSLMGGALSDSIIGASGDDELNGGAGNDDLRGGNGNDTVYGGDDDDFLSDSDGANLLSGGNGDDKIFSTSALRSYLNGGAGDDVMLSGRADDNLVGGAGSDHMTGGFGQDQFTFNTALVAGEVDEIHDFGYLGVNDRIVLAASVFTGLSAGTLKASQFVVGTAATDANDRIIYNKSAGEVWYDPDGSGDNAAMHFLDFGLKVDSLTFADFTII